MEDKEKKVYEYENVFIPDEKERKRIWERGTEEETRELAFGTVMTALGRKKVEESKMDVARFLVPTIRQYTFDETMEQLVRALWERKWKVPGIDVKFHYYGPQEAYSMVDTIQGPDFRLWFCRRQGKINSYWSDTAAVSDLSIPKKELHVFEDFSGPVLYTYVGDNWEKDKETFEKGMKVNSKLNGEPRTFLEYKGSPYPTKEADHRNFGRYRPGVLQPYLLHTDDLGRQYGLNSGDPESFGTQDVFNEFNEFFKTVVIKI